MESARTERLEFMTTVYILPLRDVFTAAKAVSTAAIVTGGRIHLGVGVGWQSLEFCETENGIELGTERIFHSFFGLDDLAVRACTASPVSVDATSWRCESETSVAVRAVTAERVVRVVAGEEREVIVFGAELVEGDHPDNVELIELWVDVATGMMVQERRTYDFVLDTPLGDAGYTEEYEWWVTSLEPIG